MIDPKYFSEQIEHLVEALQKRGVKTEIVESVKNQAASRKKILQETEALRAERNHSSAEIAKIKKSGGNVDELMARMKQVSDKLKTLEADLAVEEEKFTALAATIPNIPQVDVPVGKSEADNKEVKVWGNRPQFAFEPKDHQTIGEKLGILDVDRATKLTGARFSVLRGAGAKLERALINFMLDVHTKEHGYEESWVPFMVNEQSLFGTGQLPKFEEDLFKVQGTSYYLIPTAEVPLTNLYRDEILEGATLPLSITAYTPCFRSEAGNYGKDTKGLIRQHQFDKVELVKFVRPEDSAEQHERLTRDAETILERLELPYRRMLLCTADMSGGSSKTYDLEVWLPAANTYREISSCSNFGDYQARRAKIRFRNDKTEKPRLVHTLNGSGLAVGRTWLAILENYQQEDGSVVVPKALRPYLGLDVIRA
jgi:seryl-tRNA synthetase